MLPAPVNQQNPRRAQRAAFAFQMVHRPAAKMDTGGILKGKINHPCVRSFEKIMPVLYHPGVGFAKRLRI